METFSEIKKKRGRPKSEVNLFANKLPGAEGCTRTLMGFAYQTICGTLLGEDHDRIALSGKNDGRLRSGYNKMAIEVGRLVNAEFGLYCDTNNSYCQEIRKIITEAFDSGCSCNELAFYFRELRLGERVGNTSALCRLILRDVDTFWNMFPKTSMKSIVNTLELAILSIKKTELKNRVDEDNGNV